MFSCIAVVFFSIALLFSLIAVVFLAIALVLLEIALVLLEIFSVFLSIALELLTISLAFFYDSPRLLYYNNHSYQLYQYIKECNKDENIVKYKDVIVKRIKSTKKEIDECFPNQKYNNLFIHFVQLWNGPYLILSLKAIIFVFLSSFLMSNIKDSYSYFIDDKTQYLFIIDYENAPHYKICLYYLVVFLAVFCASEALAFFTFAHIYSSGIRK